MLAALIIVFREVFEAGLIVGIVLAATQAVPRRGRWIAGGILGGVFGSCIVAIFAGTIATLFEGMGQELFNATVLGIAVVMLTWHNVWMSRHGKELAAEVHAVGRAVVEGAKSLAALAIVIGIAVLREGSEIVLFLYGILTSETSDFAGVAMGGAAGLALGGLVSFITYRGLVRIPMRHLFAVTTALIALLAAGMAAQAVSFLERADAVTWLGETVWDSAWLLSQKSLIGSALHTLVGYSDRPTGMQLLVYLASLTITYVLMRATAANAGFTPENTRA